MERLIDFHAPEVQAVLPLLLEDKSTGHNIIWATDPPEELRAIADDKSEITIPQLQQMGYEAILPRMMKQADTQQERTRKKGEVFSPAWVCNKMNNALDADWFGLESAQAGPFTRELPQSWQTVPESVPFPESKRKTPAWQQYVDSRRLEVTCGEAPFLASRYDAATGVMIPVTERIGILDRKLRVVSENAADEADWYKWAIRAVQATYGYEYQGDNLLLARTNLLLTVTEHLQARWHRPPTTKELHAIANIIAWNVWQMDGLHLSVPGGKPQPEVEQMDFFSMFGTAEEQLPAISCKIKDWRANKTQDFETIQEGSTSMKFDYVIGNPPYQDERQGTSTTALPVYNNFMDASYQVGNSVMLITPARFLFNAGRTPKPWNEKMLNDEHLKVLYYEKDGDNVFPNTDIKGGVAITYRDEHHKYGAIGTFTIFPELNTILRKVKSKLSKGSCLADIMFVASKFNTVTLFEDFPVYAGHERRMSSNILTFDCFHDDMAKNDVSVYGIVKGKRQHRYINARYVDLSDTNIERYKLILPKADGNGTFGDTLTNPEILPKYSGFTHTFLGIGSFDTELETKSEMKYVKTKFARALLGVLKVTQDNNADKWKYVPLQDFTSNSDIDWSKSVAEIDQQLYKKYDLSAEEIDFIETHVKEMA